MLCNATTSVASPIGQSESCVGVVSYVAGACLIQTDISPRTMFGPSVNSLVVSWARVEVPKRTSTALMCLMILLLRLCSIVVDVRISSLMASSFKARDEITSNVSRRRS